MYHDLGCDHFKRRSTDQQKNRLVKRLSDLGYAVELSRSLPEPCLWHCLFILISIEAANPLRGLFAIIVVFRNFSILRTAEFQLRSRLDDGAAPIIP
jgi:hypothetical protein